MISSTKPSTPIINRSLLLEQITRTQIPNLKLQASISRTRSPLTQQIAGMDTVGNQNVIQFTGKSEMDTKVSGSHALVKPIDHFQKNPRRNYHF